MSFNPDYFYTIGYKKQALFEYYNHSSTALSADVSIPFNATAYEVGLLNSSNDHYAKLVQADFPGERVYVEFDNGVTEPCVYLYACAPLEYMVEKFAGYLGISVPVLPDLTKFMPAHVGMRPGVHSGIRIIVRSLNKGDIEEWCLANGLSTANFANVDADDFEISFDLIDNVITNPTILYSVTSDSMSIASNAWYQQAVAHGRQKIAECYSNVVLIDRAPMVKLSLSADLPGDYLKVYLMALPRIQ